MPLAPRTRIPSIDHGPVMDPYDDTNPIPPRSPGHIAPIPLHPVAPSPSPLSTPLPRSPSIHDLTIFDHEYLASIPDRSSREYNSETEREVVATPPFPPSHWNTPPLRVPLRSATAPDASTPTEAGTLEGRAVGEHLLMVTQERDDAQHNTRKLDAQLRQVKSELALLKQALVNERQEVAERDAAIGRLKEEIVAKDYECAEQLASKDCAFSEMEGEKERIFAAMVADKDKLVAQEAHNYRQLQDTLRARDEALAHSHGKMVATTNSLVTTQGHLAMRERELTCLRAKVEALTRALSGKDKEVAEVADLRADLARAKKTIEAQFKALDPKVIVVAGPSGTSGECKCATLESVLREKEAALPEALRALQDVKRALQQRNEQLEQRNAQLEAALEEIEETAAALADKEATLELRNEVLASTAGTLNNTWATLEDVQSQRVAAEEKLEGAKSKLAMFEMEVHGLRGQVTILTEERDELKEECGELRTQVTELMKERQDLLDMVEAADLSVLWSSHSVSGDCGKAREREECDAYEADDENAFGVEADKDHSLDERAICDEPDTYADREPKSGGPSVTSSKIITPGNTGDFPAGKDAPADVEMNTPDDFAEHGLSLIGMEVGSVPYTCQSGRS